MAFRENTVFVVGAGASAEFGLPVGSELAKRIKKSAKIEVPNYRTASKSSSVVFENLRRLWVHDNIASPVLEAAEKIHKSIHTAVSIDALIDRFDDTLVSKVGKMLIALEISRAEADSSLMPDTWSALDNDPKLKMTNRGEKYLITPEDTWLGSFFRTLCDGVKNPAELGRNVKIIWFNYDRCIEYYLGRQIAAAYGLKLEDAQVIIAKQIDIIHPYGTLGPLAAANRLVDHNVVVFGGPKNEQEMNLEAMTEGIRTYTERSHDTSTIKEIHEIIANARILCFLGFGFNNQNLDLLRLPLKQALEYSIDLPIIYSSGKGIAKQAEKTLKRRIRQLFRSQVLESEADDNRIQIEFGQTCSELFVTHSMNLSKFTRSYFDIDEYGGTVLRRILSPSIYHDNDE